MAKKKQPPKTELAVKSGSAILSLTLIFQFLSLLLLVGIACWISFGSELSSEMWNQVELFTLYIFASGCVMLAMFWQAKVRSRTFNSQTKVPNSVFGIFVIAIVGIGFCVTTYIFARQPESSHFQNAETSTFAEWILFVLSHLFKASDLIDLLEAYGIELTEIKAESKHFRIVLVVFHLLVSIAVAGIVFGRKMRSISVGTYTDTDRLRDLAEIEEAEAISEELKIEKDLLEKKVQTEFEEFYRKQSRKLLLQAWLAVFSVCGYFGLGIFRNWSLETWILWPFEQLARLIDIADIMNTYSLRMVPKDESVFAGSVATLFRVSCGVVILGIIGRFFRLTRVPSAPIPEYLPMPLEYDDFENEPMAEEKPLDNKKTNTNPIQLLQGDTWYLNKQLPNELAKIGYKPKSHEESFRIWFLKGEYDNISKAGKEGISFLVLQHQKITSIDFLLRLGSMKSRSVIPVLFTIWNRLAEKPNAKIVDQVLSLLEGWLSKSPCPLDKQTLTQISRLRDITGYTKIAHIRAEAHLILGLIR